MSNPTDFWINCLPIATHAIEIPSKVNQLMAAWWLSQPPWKIWSNKGHPGIPLLWLNNVEQLNTTSTWLKLPPSSGFFWHLGTLAWHSAPKCPSQSTWKYPSLAAACWGAALPPQCTCPVTDWTPSRPRRVAQALIETIKQGAVLQLARLHDRCVWMEVIELCIGRDIHCMEPHLERLEEWTQVVGTVLVRLHEQDFLIKRIQPREGYVQAAATRQDLVNVFLKPFWEARFGKVQLCQLCIQICHKERDVKPACRVHSCHEGLLHHLLWNIKPGLIADPSCPGPNLLLQMLNFLPELGVGQPQGHKMRGTCSSCS